MRNQNYIKTREGGLQECENEKKMREKWENCKQDGVKMLRFYMYSQ